MVLCVLDIDQTKLTICMGIQIQMYMCVFDCIFFFLIYIVLIWIACYYFWCSLLTYVKRLSKKGERRRKGRPCIIKHLAMNRYILSWAQIAHNFSITKKLLLNLSQPTWCCNISPWARVLCMADILKLKSVKVYSSVNPFTAFKNDP